MFGIYLPVDEGYFLHFQGLLYSLKDLLDVEHKIIIVDIGLSVRNTEILYKHFKWLNFEILKIDWTSDDKKTYRFKVKVIELMLNSSFDYTMLLDSKNHLKSKLSFIISLLEKSPVLIQDISPYLEKDWTHKTALEFMGVSENEKILNSNQYQSNNPVFDRLKSIDIMKDIVKYGMNDTALCPLGSSKSFEGDSRHRQDQSVISVVLKLHGIKPTYELYSNYHNTIHI